MPSNYFATNASSMVINWQNQGTGTYQYSISKYIDFTSDTPTTGTTDGTTYTFTHGVTAITQYFWRVRFKGTADSDYGLWHDVNTFYVGTAFGTTVGTSNVWTLIHNTGTVTESYNLNVEPLDWEFYPQYIWKAKSPNLKGNVKTEWVATKWDILLDYSQQANLGTADKNEILRYYNKHDSLYIARNMDSNSTTSKITKIWKVLFEEAPQIERTGGLSLSFREV